MMHWGCSHGSTEEEQPGPPAISAMFLRSSALSQLECSATEGAHVSFLSSDLVILGIAWRLTVSDVHLLERGGGPAPQCSND
jgi:hypothetical protein